MQKYLGILRGEQQHTAQKIHWETELPKSRFQKSVTSDDIF